MLIAIHTMLLITMGNFKAILEFRALGDPVLRQHLEHGQKNAQLHQSQDTE